MMNAEKLSPTVLENFRTLESNWSAVDTARAALTKALELFTALEKHLPDSPALEAARVELGLAAEAYAVAFERADDFMMNASPADLGEA